MFVFKSEKPEGAASVLLKFNSSTNITTVCLVVSENTDIEDLVSKLHSGFRKCRHPLSIPATFCQSQLNLLSTSLANIDQSLASHEVFRDEKRGVRRSSNYEEPEAASVELNLVGKLTKELVLTEQSRRELKQLIGFLRENVHCLDVDGGSEVHKKERSVAIISLTNHVSTMSSTLDHFMTCKSFKWRLQSRHDYVSCS